MRWLTVFIVMGCMVAVRADSLCHDKFMQSIQYQLKLFGDQSCTGDSHYERRRIGFSATSTKNQENVAKDSVVIFDKVISNDGNAYNPNNGIFTAPVEGLYLFSWSVNSAVKKKFVTHLLLNGEEKGRNHAGADGNFNAPATQIVTLHLKPGDKVEIKTYIYVGLYMYGDFWSIFSGVLIA